MEKYTIITKDGQEHFFDTDVDKIIAYDRNEIKGIIVELWINNMLICSATMTPYEFFVENLGLENF